MTTTAFTVDTSHSDVAFTVRHMVFAKVKGHFTKWTAELAYDSNDPTQSSLAVDIDVASVDTRESQRDGHLRSADFFDAEKYPKITYKSRRIDRAGENKFRVIGDLTLHGVTRETVLEVEQLGAGKDPWGNERLGFEAHANINRTDFGLKWNQALETGGLLVGENVEIEINVEAMAAKEQKVA
jgi:polyisoprenoid-binding protein YceI